MYAISDGQKLAIIKLCQKCFGNNDRNLRLYFLYKLLDKKIKSVDDLDRLDWIFIRDYAYQNWTEDDWEISEQFIKYANRIKLDYEEEVLGQRSLF